MQNEGIVISEATVSDLCPLCPLDVSAHPGLKNFYRLSSETFSSILLYGIFIVYGN